VSEVDEFQHAVDHRVAEGDGGVEKTAHQTIDHDLRQDGYRTLNQIDVFACAAQHHGKEEHNSPKDNCTADDEKKDLKERTENLTHKRAEGATPDQQIRTGSCFSCHEPTLASIYF